MSPYLYLIVCTFLCINNIETMEWSVLGFSSQEFRKQSGVIIILVIIKFILSKIVEDIQYMGWGGFTLARNDIKLVQASVCALP